jgi:G3E family GTPase
MNQIPVTVLSGFAGAGKTSLLHRLRAAHEGARVAVLKSDLGEGDVDYGLAESTTTDGSIHCKSREHLALELRKVGRAKAWDHLLIESTGWSEPMPVAETFVANDGGTPVSRYLKIDTMITVIDASKFLADYASLDTMKDRGLAASDRDVRSVVDVLVAQVELADVLVLNKADLSDEASLSGLEAFVRKLNPRAKVVRATNGDAPVASVKDTGLFDFDAARDTVTAAHMVDMPPAPPEHGYAMLGYRRFRPFHPERFDALLGNGLPGILRSKGMFWLAHKNDTAGEWSQAGAVLHRGTAGAFWAATPEKDWDVGDARKAKIKSIWSEPHGDRRQEMAFVLHGLSAEALEKQLDACLLTDEEMATGPEGWKSLAPHDPVPGAPTDDHGHDHDHHDHDHAPVEGFKGHTPEGGKHMQ